MAITSISHASSLNPGSDLWVLPMLDQSHWARQIDWYLNFQLSHASRHKESERPQMVIEWLNACDIKAPRFLVPTHKRWLIPSSMLLPNRWVMMMDADVDSGIWVEQIAKCWLDMGKPTLRVFLPPQLSKDEFDKIWVRHQEFTDFGVVSD